MRPPPPHTERPTTASHRPCAPQMAPTPHEGLTVPRHAPPLRECCCAPPPPLPRNPSLLLPIPPLTGWQRPSGAPPGPRTGGRPRGCRATATRRDWNGCERCVRGYGSEPGLCLARVATRQKSPMFRHAGPRVLADDTPKAGVCGPSTAMLHGCLPCLIPPPLPLPTPLSQAGSARAARLQGPASAAGCVNARTRARNRGDSNAGSSWQASRCAGKEGPGGKT